MSIPPLARIIMEQVRPQLGGFGSSKHPNCHGLTPHQLEDVDWGVIDLSEWQGRLAEANLMPTTEDQIESMWNPDNTSKFELAYGSAPPPGPDGQIDKKQEALDRYKADKLNNVRSTLAEEPTCYGPNRNEMPWYGQQEITPQEVIVDVGGDGHIGNCGEGCIDIYVGSTVSNSLGPDNCSHIYEQYYDVKVLRPDLIQSAIVAGFAWNDHIQLLINGSLIYQGPYANQFPPEQPGTCQLGTNWCMGDPGNTYCMTTLPYPNPFDVTANFQYEGIVHTLSRVAVGGTGLGYARIQVRYDNMKDPSDITSECFQP